jgi:hypothetical protein
MRVNYTLIVVYTTPLVTCSQSKNVSCFAWIWPNCDRWLFNPCALPSIGQTWVLASNDALFEIEKWLGHWKDCLWSLRQMVLKRFRTGNRYGWCKTRNTTEVLLALRLKYPSNKHFVLRTSIKTCTNFPHGYIWYQEEDLFSYMSGFQPLYCSMDVYLNSWGPLLS